MHFKKHVLVALIMLMPLNVLAGSVSSMSSEQVVVGPNGVKYIQSTVNCAASNELRTIWREESGGDWCARDIAGYCARRKISAAQNVCGRRYRIAAAEERAQSAKNVPAATRSEEHKIAVIRKMPESEPDTGKGESGAKIVSVGGMAKAPVSQEGGLPVSAAPSNQELERQRQQLEIERQRLRIEQERLELHRQQVELQKQELEIRRQLTAHEKVKSVERTTDGESLAGRTRNEKPSNTVKKNVLGM